MIISLRDRILLLKSTDVYFKQIKRKRMQYKDIEIFLELVNSRNITKASEHLFVSQSVISTRLKKLEEELGYELFLRAKGMREIELTRQGREFVNVAMRWKNLYEEAELIREESGYTLRIASPESVYFDFLEPLLFRILRRHPEIRVSASIGDSAGIYDMMVSGVIDFGFASYESTHYDIYRQQIYRQSFCLAINDPELGKNGPVSPRELEPEKEVRLTGGNFSNISLWREKWFAGKNRSRIEVNSPHMIANCLKEFGTWALLPSATAGMLVHLYGVRTCELTDAPDSRKIYLLRHTGGSRGSADAERIFGEELRIYLSEREAASEGKYI